MWRKCPPSRAFLPAFPFFHRRAHRCPPVEGRKSPLHARVYKYRSGERRKGQRAVRRLSLWKRVARCEGCRVVVPPRGERPHGRAGFAERSGGGCRQWAAGGARRDGASESGRSGALRLHPSRNGRRGTGVPRPMRLHNSRSISNIVSERCVQIMIYVGRSNKFLHNFSTVLYISPVKTSSAHRFFERCAENLCFTLFSCPAVVKKHPETPQGSG